MPRRGGVIPAVVARGCYGAASGEANISVRRTWHHEGRGGAGRASGGWCWQPSWYSWPGLRRWRCCGPGPRRRPRWPWPPRRPTAAERLPPSPATRPWGWAAGCSWQPTRNRRGWCWWRPLAAGNPTSTRPGTTRATWGRLPTTAMGTFTPRRRPGSRWWIIRWRAQQPSGGSMEPAGQWHRS